MPTLHVHLLGKFCLRHDGAVVAGLEARRTQELFTYLLLHRRQAQARESLIETLWGDGGAASSKKGLRQTLWQLQSALDARAEPGTERVLLVEPEWIQVNAAADVWLDVAVLEEVYARVQGCPGEALDAAAAAALRQAVDGYGGDLLEGCYRDWCLFERERLQNIYLAMLDKLMTFCEAHHDFEDGLLYGERILRVDRVRERTHRRLMRLHYLAGDRAAALRQFERCSAILAEELGVEPSQRTLTLYQQVRADQFDPAPAATAPATTTPLVELLGRLQQLQAVLDSVQQQVRREIQAVERALHK